MAELPKEEKERAFILWFDQVGIEDVLLVGGKNASLGEMYRHLTPKGVRIPNGFAVTAYAYRYFIEKTGVKAKIEELLRGLDIKNVHQLIERGSKIRHAIVGAELPPELQSEILKAYAALCEQYAPETDVAVRSSATAEDLPEASFAGQQETFLNIKGGHALLDAIKRCFASLFTNRAISYRVDKGFDHFRVYISVGVQKMVRSDLACSGVMFTIDTESGFPEVVLINAAYGLGENVVKGVVNPDEYYVFKPTLRQGFRAILSKTVGTKEFKMIYDIQGTAPTKNVPVDPGDRRKFCLGDDEITELAKMGLAIEDHYSEKAGRFKPMDIEWAKDGETGQLFIVQARPETVQALKPRNILENYVLKQRGKILARGKSVGSKVAVGEGHVLRDVKEITRFKPGQVLVTEMTDPDWEPIMKIAAAIVTNRGGRTSHAAIVSRELGLPCVVGTGNATDVIKSGQQLTVSCAEGDIGFVYEGALPFEIEKIDLGTLPKTRTKIMMNVGNPEEAFELSWTPNDGVGLAREEFIINEYIKVHPRALIDFERLSDRELKEQIEGLTYGYADKRAFFVDRLASGIAMIAAAFWPKDVILRFSDFKSNEYANLIGGKLYEPREENPMLGWRGASRYYSDYAEAFGLECAAVRKVRGEIGLKNLKVMVPFCRTLEEGRAVLAEMARHGLKSGVDGLQIYVMAEIPSNILLAEGFAELFDGFSIGTNDLTQLTLGLDRDSELVAHIYDERNEAVKALVARMIKVAREKGKKIGICGDAPSTYPEFAQFLVECGIDSISLSPDAVLRGLLAVAEKERQLGIAPR